jgi:predicted phage terminase large subunit-like protein
VVSSWAAIAQVKRLRQLAASSTPRAASRIERFASLGLLDFVPAISPRYQRPEHLAPLVAEFERSWSEPVRCTGHAPPRHAKTETVLAFIALTLAKHPDWPIGYITYSAELAQSKSARARAMVERIGIPLAGDTNRLNEWRTTSGGGLLASGIGGPLTGHGVKILVVDDPYRNRQQAESAAYRRMVLDWQADVGNTRIEPGGSEFIFHTRWVGDDLIGHVHENEGLASAGGVWTDVKMPAVSDDGRALWPERWPLEALRRIEAANEYTWASLYQGRPRPRGGAVFRNVATFERLPETTRTVIGVDFAYTAKTSSDYSVAVVVSKGVTVDPTLAPPKAYVREVVRRQVEATAFAAELRRLKTQYPQAKLVATIGGTERGVVDMLNAPPYALGIATKPARTDKFVRAQPVAAAWNAERVLVHAGAPWASDFVAEVCGFTGVGDKHDDQIDALAAAYDELVEGGGDIVTAPLARVVGKPAADDWEDDDE